MWLYSFEAPWLSCVVKRQFPLIRQVGSGYFIFHPPSPIYDSASLYDRDKRVQIDLSAIKCCSFSFPQWPLLTCYLNLFPQNGQFAWSSISPPYLTIDKFIKSRDKAFSTSVCKLVYGDRLPLWNGNEYQQNRQR